MPPPPPPAKDRPSSSRSASRITKPLPATPKFELPALQPVVFSLTDGTNIPPPAESPIDSIPPPVPGRGREDLHSRNGVGSHPWRDQQGARIGDAQTVIGGAAPGTGHESSGSRLDENKRTNSIRRFLSRKALNTNFVAGGGSTNGYSSGQNGARMNGHAQTSLDNTATKAEGPELRPESPASFLGGRTGLSRAGSMLGNAGERWYRRLSTGPSRKREIAMPEEPRTDLARPGTGTVTTSVGVGYAMTGDTARVSPRLDTGPPAPRLPELRTLREDEGMGDDIFKNIK